MGKRGPNPGEYKHSEEAKKKSGEKVIKSGAFSVYRRRRYSDITTPEGAQLAKVIKGLTDDYGGAEKMTASGMLLLDSIRAKLIVLFQISAYIDQQPIITKDGALIPCLSKGYIAFSNALRRDLVALGELAKIKPSKVPTLKQIISEHEAIKNES